MIIESFTQIIDPVISTFGFCSQSRKPIQKKNVHNQGNTHFYFIEILCNRSTLYVKKWFQLLLFMLGISLYMDVVDLISHCCLSD